jgi:hypothetical protein
MTILQTGFSGFNGVSEYQIDRSLRFRQTNSAYLNRVFTGSGNRKTWTWSSWVKRGAIGAGQDLFGYYISGINESIRIGADDKLYRYCVDTSGTVNRVLVNTNAILRDTSAWYHLMVVQDTPQATDSNRIKIYINGVLQSLNVSVWPSQNWDGYFNTPVNHQLFGSSAIFFDGLQTDTYFIDGQALTPFSFGETGSTGNWKPKAYLGTYGSNGFYLKYNNLTSTTTLGLDSSGNNNHWNANGISLDTTIPFSVTGTDVTRGKGMFANKTLPAQGDGTNCVHFPKSDGTYTLTRPITANSKIEIYCYMDGFNPGTITANGGIGKTVPNFTPAFSWQKVNLGVTSLSSFSISANWSGTDFWVSCIIVDDVVFYVEPVGTALYDSMIDVPLGGGGNERGNYATLNPLINGDGSAVYTDGNLTVSGVPYYAAKSTLPVSAVKSYWEVLINACNSQDVEIGIQSFANSAGISSSGGYGWGIKLGRKWENGNATAGYSTATVGDIIAFTYDNVVGQLGVYKNNNLQFTITGIPTGIDYWVSVGGAGSPDYDNYTFNFGQQGFKYTPPTGFKALHTGNLPTPLIEKPREHFDILTHTGGITINLTDKAPTVVIFNDGYSISNNSDFSGWGSSRGSIGVSSGKWYFEGTISFTNGDPIIIGVSKSTFNPATQRAGDTADSFVIARSAGVGYKGNSNSFVLYGTAYANGDNIGVALDLDAGTLSFYINGVSQGVAYTGLSGTFYPVFSLYATQGAQIEVNFGQRSFYSLPAGFSYFYNNKITGTLFEPGLLWYKARNETADSRIIDNIRGVSYPLYSNINSSEGNETGGVTSFNGNGFSISNSLYANKPGISYVDWLWKAGTLTSTNVGDPYFNKVSLLLHADGINGSTTFLDSSVNGRLATAIGNTRISNTQSKFGGTSIYFDGVGDGISFSESVNFGFGTGNFTIEGSVFLTENAPSTGSNLFDFRSSLSVNPFTINISNKGGGNLFGVYTSFGNTEAVGSTPLELNRWYHLAFVRNNGAFSLYVNGSLETYSTGNSTSANGDFGSSSPLKIGIAVNGVNDPFIGFMDEIRITKGIARYTGNNFSPPSLPFADVSIDGVLNNTNGTINSQVSVNSAAGFSIVSYTGVLPSTGAETVGHGLGVAPKVVITKSRNPNGSDSGLWMLRGTAISWNTNDYLRLDSTGPVANDGGNGFASLPTSTTFGVNGSSGQAQINNNYIAYCFAEVPGYSKFGRYLGNGSSDGTFVYCGFKPRWILIKSTTETTHWYILDSVRDTYNIMGNQLEANLNNAESFAGVIDFVASGFKIRTPSAGSFNGNGVPYFFMAFADTPFKYALAQ